MNSVVADRLFDGLVELDATGRVRTWNAAAQRITGYAAAQVVGRGWLEQPSRPLTEAGSPLPREGDPLLLTARDGQAREMLISWRHADGFRLTTLLRTAALSDALKRRSGAAGIFTDNKALIAAFQAIPRREETVLLDPLTGIGNRPHIEAKIKAAIETFQDGGEPFGVLFIDVDHFKEFNDRHGHLLGDRILRVAANTLRQNLRATDSCGRWGGEEFIAMVRNLDAAGLARVAEKLRVAVSQSRVSDKDGDLSVSVSIGASLVRAGDTLQSLLERTDKLMYESKRLGRNRVTTEP